MGKCSKEIMACGMANSVGMTLLSLILFLEKVRRQDLYIVLYLIIGIIFYSTGRIMKKSIMIEIYHYMLAVIFGLIPIISKNKEILNWHLLFIIFTLASRKVFNGCIVRKGERKDAITQNSFTNMFNWDIIFPLLGVASMVKLYIYH